MPDPSGQQDYYHGPVGDLFIRPQRVRVRATYSTSGPTWTVSSTRRQSHKGVTITPSTGSHAVAGLPRGSDYHVAGCEILPPTGTQLTNVANALIFDASAGTLTFKTRRSDSGAEAAPADGTVLHLTLDVETGVY
jgi:hypothetical protein